MPTLNWWALDNSLKWSLCGEKSTHSCVNIKIYIALAHFSSPHILFYSGCNFIHCQPDNNTHIEVNKLYSLEKKEKKSSLWIGAIFFTIVWNLKFIYFCCFFMRLHTRSVFRVHRTVANLSWHVTILVSYLPTF